MRVVVHLRVHDEFEQRSDCQLVFALLGHVPRHRRVVIDCDGTYNDALNVVRRREPPGRGVESSTGLPCATAWPTSIYQPTYRPLRPNVRPFFFHALQPGLGSADRVPRQAIRHGVCRQQLVPLAAVASECWRRSNRSARGGAASALVGQGWDAGSPGADRWQRATPTDTGPAGTLRRLGVDVLPPVRFDRVVRLRWARVFSPVSTARCSTICGW